MSITEGSAKDTWHSLAPCEVSAMDLFVLVHNDTGKYVAVCGAEHSYTDKLQEARVFRSAQTARFAACPESEMVVSVEALLRR